MELESIGHPAAWAGFLAFVLVMLALDLGVFHKRAHAVTLKEAAGWSAAWVALALGFGAWIWHAHGSRVGLEFLTGYVIEKALSVDNIFVFAVVFSAFAIPPALQHRVLFWGILGALAMRAAFVVAGAALLARFHWMILVFGALLALTGIKLLLHRAPPDPANNKVMRVLRRVLPMSDRLDGERFVTRVDGRRVATPLLVALLAIEWTDVVFAIDSIPAIFAVTTDPFVVFTSNIFAILGLRSLYFLLAGVLERFRHLKVGLALVLVFVGAKMLALDFVKVPVGVSLGVIGAILGISIVTSLFATRPAKPRPTASPGC